MLAGTYLPIKALTSGSPMLFFINVNILNRRSTIAMKKTNDENLLKNITTNTINIINTTTSIYINYSYLKYGLLFISSSSVVTS